MKDNINIINKFHSDGILVVDFGSQYTQLIARRVREEGVFCQIIPFNRVENYLLENEPNGIILSGGPASVLEEETPKISEKIITSKKPILGICYGQQTLVKQLGGKVVKTGKSEFGRAKIKIVKDCVVLQKVYGI